MNSKFVFIVMCMAFSLTCSAQERAKARRWLPDHLKVQYAGGIGFLSAGVGYQNKKDKLEGDLYYGYVPKSLGGVTIHALTGKVTWYPIKRLEVKGIGVKPLSVGTLVSYNFGQQYFLFSPEYYPYNYYDFPTAMFVGVFMGGQLDKSIKGNRRVAVYYELGTNDRELASHLKNGATLKFTKILNLAIGVKTSL